jgi:hypothetical protein
VGQTIHGDWVGYSLIYPVLLLQELVEFFYQARLAQLFTAYLSSYAAVHREKYPSPRDAPPRRARGCSRTSAPSGQCRAPAKGGCRMPPFSSASRNYFDGIEFAVRRPPQGRLKSRPPQLSCFPAPSFEGVSLTSSVTPLVKLKLLRFLVD